MALLALLAALAFPEQPTIERLVFIKGVPRSKVWAVIHDMPSWSKWTKVFRIEGLGHPLRVGDRFEIISTWRNGLKAWSAEALTAVDFPKLCWEVAVLPKVFLATDRCIEFQDFDKDGLSTKLANNIAFKGLLGPVVHFFMAKAVGNAFEDFNADLQVAAQNIDDKAS